MYTYNFKMRTTKFTQSTTQTIDVNSITNARFHHLRVKVYIN